ncbi:hypothetical protein GK047_01095 [Paenibacillus sp. SYP-B3998]|uniref:Uncharacterized protein n=1 Tax=Paenibacillus sp. SYP-B3998 TaxID=2678564 RepID=A0A6G3ZRE5_9BACL|nr:hypothetical protein [Paenibacillus sp. SYP-B3998]NEW04620.1 hypothetical protein [Paenibacillus sp. SYP-B3998]
MSKLYAIDLAKKLYRENNKSYYVIQEPETDEFNVVDKDELVKKNLNRYVIFSIETD